MDTLWRAMFVTFAVTLFATVALQAGVPVERVQYVAVGVCLVAIGIEVGRMLERMGL